MAKTCDRGCGNVLKHPGTCWRCITTEQAQRIADLERWKGDATQIINDLLSRNKDVHNEGRKAAFDLLCAKDGESLLAEAGKT